VWPLRTFADSLTRATQKAEAHAEADAAPSAAPEDVAREARARLVQRASLSAALEAVRCMLPTLDDDDAQALVADGLSWRDLQEGETVFEQGDTADAVYVVLSGVVNVSTRDPYSALDVAAHQPTSGAASQPDGSTAELLLLSPVSNLSLTPRTNLSFSPRSSLHLDSPRSAVDSSTVSPRPSMHMASPRVPGTYSALWQAALPAKPVHVPPSHLLARVLRPGELLGELVRASRPSTHLGGGGGIGLDDGSCLSRSLALMRGGYEMWTGAERAAEGTQIGHCHRREGITSAPHRSLVLHAAPVRRTTTERARPDAGGGVRHTEELPVVAYVQPPSATVPVLWRASCLCRAPVADVGGVLHARRSLSV